MFAARLSIVASNGCIHVWGAWIWLAMDIICWVDENVIPPSLKLAVLSIPMHTFRLPFSERTNERLNHSNAQHSHALDCFFLFLFLSRENRHTPAVWHRPDISDHCANFHYTNLHVHLHIASYRIVSHRLAWHCCWKWSAHIAALCFYGRIAKLPYEYRFEDYSNWIHGNFGISEERESSTLHQIKVLFFCVPLYSRVLSFIVHFTLSLSLSLQLFHPFSSHDRFSLCVTLSLSTITFEWSIQINSFFCVSNCAFAALVKPFLSIAFHTQHCQYVIIA